MSIAADLVWALTALVGLSIMAGAALKAWHGWLALRRLELEGDTQAEDRPFAPRIEIADMRERLRKLEAIARGVDI